VLWSGVGWGGERGTCNTKERICDGDGEFFAEITTFLKGKENLYIVL
jgi:hypothetical protein